MNPFHWAKGMPRAAMLAAGAMALVAAHAAPLPNHIRGTIASVTPSQLTVRTTQGSVKIAIDPATRIAAIVPGRRDQIKAGTFVGIANVPGAGTSRALEVVVFPDSMRGTGLGDYPWDLSPKSGGKSSAMTNGTVTAATAGAAKTFAMTNGTVKSTSSANGLLLAVDYGQGEKKILVPAGVPVVGVVPADASKLAAGAHVFVTRKKDAPETAGYIAVGIDGAVPPM